MKFKDYIVDRYKSVIFARRDPDRAVHQFSYKDFPGLVCEEYNLVSPNGKISGCFYYYAGYAPDRLIVFEHGMGAGHRAYMREIEHICSIGYRIFTYDHIGTSLSEGKGMRGLSGSICDLDFVIGALRRDEALSRLRFDVIGHSWGGFSAMTISHFHGDIEHIVAMSGFVSVKTLQAQITPPIFKKYRDELFALESAENPGYASLSALDVLEKTNSKVLIIHSKDDKTVNYNLHFMPLFEKFKDKSNISFLTLERKNHNPTYTVEAAKYKEAFFKKLKFRRRFCKKDPSFDEKFRTSFDFYKMTEQDSFVFDRIKEFLES